MEKENILRRYKVFILDVDGVLIRGGVPFPGAAAAVQHLRQQGRVILLTNNSTRSRQQVAEHFQVLGFPIEPEMVVSSAYIAARYLLETGKKRSVWTLGEEGLKTELSLAGHRLVRPTKAEWVVVGMDRHLSYDKLSQALAALLAGADLLATNTDGTFPTPEGLQPGAGAAVGALAGMGFAPKVVVGKPSPIAYQIALEGSGHSPKETLMIGDRLETDILGANRAGIDSALVLSGVSCREDIPRQGIHPTLIASDLAALVRDAGISC
jgi:4-nitrophenyl phosphatase